MTSKKSTLIVLAMMILGNWVFADTRSVLDRVTVVDDPELGACIRMALDNVLPPNALRGLDPSSSDQRKEIASYEISRLKVVRAVTELYAQIKLLDDQIEQVSVKINDHTPSAIRHELVLAQAELQSKRIQELAKLRETMGVVPRHALGHIQVSQLKTLMVLDVLDEGHVLVFECLSPFTEYIRKRNYRFVTQLPSDQVTDTVRKIISDKQRLPLRIEVLYRDDSFKLSEHIHKQLIELTKQSNAQIDADLRLQEHLVRYGSSKYLNFIAGKIGGGVSLRTIQTRTGQRMRGYELNDILTPATLDKSVKSNFFLKPGMLPVKWVLEHDESGKEQAQEYVKKVKVWAKENNIEEYVNVSLEITTRDWQEHQEKQETETQN